MVLDMSHQTPFPNELRKWSTIWPHLQHLDYTNREQREAASCNCLNLLRRGDCAVLGVCCSVRATARAAASVPAGGKSGGSVAARKVLTDRLRSKRRYLCRSKGGGKQEGNKC